MNELDRLILILLRICALDAQAKLKSEEYDFLRTYKSQAEVWDKLLRIMQIGKIDNFVYFALKNHDLTGFLPTNILKQLFESYVSTSFKNKAKIKRLNQILRALNEIGIIPTLWKGIVLMQYYYPDPGTRSMSDIDFYIPLEKKRQAMKVFLDLGFKDNPSLEISEECFNGIDPQGIKIDVHYVAVFFEEFQESVICVEYTTESNSKFFTCESNAFLALLIEHQRGHFLIDGVNYRYFFDLIFFYQKHMAELDYQKISNYLKTSEHWNLLNRSNLFIQKLLPDFKAPFNEKFNKLGRPFDIEEIYISSLFGMLGLTIRYKAWGRLVLTWFRLIEKKHKIYPTFKEAVSFFYYRLKYKLII